IFLEGRPPTEVRNLLSSCTYGTPPLVIASRNGHVDVVHYLIKKGVDIEQTGCVVFDGETVEGVPSLWCAAAAGHFEIVKLLVDNKADVNHTTATNSTPLRAACFDGHLNIITYLVERGADVEIANKHGHTSLMIACYKSRIDVVKYLLSVNANVNTKSLKGNTALHDSAEAGNTEIVELLLDHGAVMDVDINGLTPMLSAASFGHKSVVDFLCQHEKCSLFDKINGLELLGATYVDKKRDIV
uniref:Uncharacterized protein n=1 Tax=Romanomermis culicivorax TaxID=13658 RepID=A0A915JAJ3_ROMCU